MGLRADLGKRMGARIAHGRADCESHNGATCVDGRIASRMGERNGERNGELIAIRMGERIVIHMDAGKHDQKQLRKHEQRDGETGKT